MADGFLSEEGSALKVNYDPEEDILYIVVKEGPVFDSKEVDEDTRLGYTGRGRLQAWRS
jgi:YD repeat-containing protein